MQATVHGVAKSGTRLSDFTFIFTLENRRIFKLNSPCLGLTSVHLIGIISFSKSCIDFKDIFTFLKV